MLRRWWFWATAAAVVVLAGGLLAWLLRPQPEPPRARQYLDYNACLLTGAQGLADKQVQPVWAGMQDASLATHARVQYLQVMGEATVGNALPYLNSLVQRRCSVVVAVGSPEVAAVDGIAGKYPAVRFVVVGGTASGPNVTVLDGLSDAQVRERVRDVLTDAVKASSR